MNSQWLIAHVYKRCSSYRYIYPWRFHVGKKLFFLGSSNAQGTGFHVRLPLLVRFTPPWTSPASFPRAVVPPLSLCRDHTPRSKILRVSNEKKGLHRRGEHWTISAARGHEVPEDPSIPSRKIKDESCVPWRASIIFYWKYRTGRER